MGSGCPRFSRAARCCSEAGETMNDAALVIAGCAVSFIALCGVYVYVREAFVYTSAAEKEAERQGRELAPVVESPAAP